MASDYASMLTPPYLEQTQPSAHVQFPQHNPGHNFDYLSHSHTPGNNSNDLEMDFKSELNTNSEECIFHSKFDISDNGKYLFPYHTQNVVYNIRFKCYITIYSISSTHLVNKGGK